MAVQHSIMVFVVVIFCLQLIEISAYTLAANGQDVSSEIGELKALYLQQQSLIEAMKHKIENQEVEIINSNEKIAEQEQKLRLTEAVNRAQTKEMDDIQRVFNSSDWFGRDIQKGISKPAQKTNVTLPICKSFKKREGRTLRTAEQVPAFYASLSSTLSHLGDHQPITFDHVYTNELNGYDAVTSIFRAPSNGVYVFSWTTMSSRNSKMTSELVINGDIKGKLRSDATDITENVSASNTVVLPIHIGDRVWVRTSNAGHSGDVYGNYFSTFSGWKLF